MFFKKEYPINEWTKWNSIVFDAIHNFHNTFSVKPNIMQANEHTYSQFDFLTNVTPGEKQNLISEEKSGQISEDEDVSLVGYICKLTDIDFAIDNQLQDKTFCLVYDDEAEWDEPETQDDFPVDENEKTEAENKLYHIFV